jgi:hypothetical protein
MSINKSLMIFSSLTLLLIKCKIACLSFPKKKVGLELSSEKISFMSSEGTPIKFYLPFKSIR